MQNVSWKPEEMQRLTPMVISQDPDRAVSFYKEAFGLEIVGKALRTESGKLMHATLGIDGEIIAMLGPDLPDDPFPPPAKTGIRGAIKLFVYVADVDALHARATAARATAIGEVQDMFWGERLASFDDPDGHRWTFATRTREVDPEKDVPPGMTLS